jgi:hypothetical protein
MAEPASTNPRRGVSRRGERRESLLERLAQSSLAAIAVVEVGERQVAVVGAKVVEQVRQAVRAPREPATTSAKSRLREPEGKASVI